MQPRGAKEALGIFKRISVGNGRAYPLAMSFSIIEASASLFASADLWLPLSL